MKNFINTVAVFFSVAGFVFALFTKIEIAFLSLVLGVLWLIYGELVDENRN